MQIVVIATARYDISDVAAGLTGLVSECLQPDLIWEVFQINGFVKTIVSARA